MDRYHHEEMKRQVATWCRNIFLTVSALIGWLLLQFSDWSAWVVILVSLFVGFYAASYFFFFVAMAMADMEDKEE